MSETDDSDADERDGRQRRGRLRRDPRRASDPSPILIPHSTVGAIMDGGRELSDR